MPVKVPQVAHKFRSSQPAAPVLPPRTRRWLLACALLGLAASAAATYTHYELLSQPGHLSFCDISSTISCSQVYQSRFGSIRGVPVALAGLVWFALVTLLVGTGGRSAAAYQGNVGDYVFVLATLGLAVILYLAYASFFVLKTVCILCLATYVAVLGLFVLSGTAISHPMRTLPRRLVTDLRALAASPRALTVTALFVAVSASAVVFFPRDMLAAAARAGSDQSSAPAAPGLTGAQRSEFETWYAQQPRVNLPVPAEGAKVLIVKFTDYQCPACAQTYLAYKGVLAKYETTNPGAIRFVSLDFPLNPECNAAVPRLVHPASCAAAVAVRLAREHGRGPAMEEWLYTNQPTMSPARVEAAAQEVGGVNDFQARYAATLAAVKTDAALGALNNVHSTPTFFINGVMLAGGLPPQYFEQAIEYELRRAQQ
jgi:uncharacterized membrane protein/protein-disulfide isomerase